ncbi:MAG: hypothetical protein AAGJ31_06235 [Verrucomicrobiota bacterium]
MTISVPHLFILASTLFLTSAAKAQLEVEDCWTQDRYVAILSAYPSFADARRDAEKMAQKEGTPFSMEGRIYDAKRGLIYPDDSPDEVFRGEYVPRRYHFMFSDSGQEFSFLSVERSDGYEGFRPGYYIVVAGIYETASEAKAQADRFRSWAPTAYAKKTQIYMGCLH